MRWRLAGRRADRGRRLGCSLVDRKQRLSVRRRHRRAEGAVGAFENVINHLAFSPDGRSLAATLGGGKGCG